MDRLQEYLKNTNDKYQLMPTVKAIIANYDNAIKSDYNSKSSDMVIGQCKSLIESLAKSILDENNIEYTENEKLSKIVKNSINTLFPENNPKFSYKTEKINSKKTFDSARNIATKFIESINSFTSELAQLRNVYCPNSHGKSINHPSLPVGIAEFIMRQTASVVKFILHLNEESKTFVRKKLDINSKECKAFNDYLDDSGVEGFNFYGNKYLTHEILFHVDYQKYQDLYDDWIKNDMESE